MTAADPGPTRPTGPTWPSRVIDPHIHQWNPFTTPRLVSGRAKALRPIKTLPGWLARLTPRDQREFVGNPQFVMKPYEPEQYRSDTGTLPVRKVVHIEAAWVGEPEDQVDETRWVLGLPWGQDGAPELGAIVAHADPRWERVGDLLDEQLAVSPLVRGVRKSAANHPDPEVRGFEDTPDLYTQPAFLDGFAAIAERGLSFELWMFAHQLPQAVRLVAEYPETTFVLCHYATPVGLFGPRGRHTGRTPQEVERMLGQWYDDVAALAAHPNVVAKHSGLGMPVLGRSGQPQLGIGHLDAFVEVVAPLVRHVHSSFGADRTMWASNFPMDKPNLTMPATAQVVLDSLGSDADPQQLFHDVAARTYRLD